MSVKVECVECGGSGEQMFYCDVCEGGGDIDGEGCEECATALASNTKIVLSAAEAAKSKKKRKWATSPTIQ